MLTSKRQALGSKSGISRFSLLLLEDGEFFLDDFSVFKYPDPVFQCLTFDACVQRKTQGRLKLCTRSIMFEPQDPMLPILKFPFRDMPISPGAEVFDEESGELYLSFDCNTMVEMKERNVDHPYVYRTLANSTVYSTKVIFSFLHSKIHDFLEAIAPLWSLAHKKNVLNKIDEEHFLAPVLEPRHTDVFDASLLADFRERPLLSKCKLVDRIVPLLKFPGAMMLTNQRVYFQPAQINNIGDPVLNFEYSKIVGLHKRRHMLKQCGLEVLLADKHSHFFSFQTMKDRDEIYDMMLKQPGLDRKFQQNYIQEMLLKWQRREISNFEYLSFLNDEAGRTTNDLTQYPVFPWIIADYTSKELDLTNPETFRDLSKPVGALNADRLAYFQQRFQNMPSGMEAEGLPPPFLYGTHYSTPGYVLFYLVRMAPEYMLCLQNGKFDAPDRLFRSIAGTYQSCLSNHADLKELIPAFFDTENPHLTEWLQNSKNLDLGTTQKLARVGDVELPPWADSPFDFVEKNREALECDYVSEHLHEWIDLIFGYKQQGAEALAANNLFYYLSLWDESLPHYFHSKSITCCIFSKDMKSVYSTSEDSTFKVSSTDDGVVRRSYNASGSVVSLDLSPDERYAFFGSSDGCVFMLELEGGRVGKLAPAHNASVSGLCVVDDSKFISCSTDGTLKIWQYGPIGMLSTPVFVYEDMDASLACIDVNSDGSIAIVGSEKGIIFVIDLRTNELLSKIKASQAKVISTRFSMLGSYFVCTTADNETITYTHEGDVTHKIQMSMGSNETVGCMASDGEYALTGSSEGGVYIWQLNEPNSKLKACTVSIPHSHKSAITALSVSGNGQNIVTGAADGSVRVWTIKKKSTRSRLGF
ncbi:unnamed protein product [Aphanomyces euteiches]